jgi:hypothetical protein
MKIIPAGNDAHAALQKESRATGAAFLQADDEGPVPAVSATRPW